MSHSSSRKLCAVPKWDDLNNTTTVEDFDFDPTWNFESTFSQLQPTLIIATMSILFFGGMVTFFRPLVMNAAAETSIAFSQPLFDPASFQPVCPASDGFYQVMKSFIATLIGQENIAEYGPLIASG
jgi:hypothetical protein